MPGTSAEALERMTFQAVPENLQREKRIEFPVDSANLPDESTELSAIMDERMD